jgi:hypothetical protein
MSLFATSAALLIFLVLACRNRTQKLAYCWQWENAADVLLRLSHAPVATSLLAKIACVSSGLHYTINSGFELTDHILQRTVKK